ncbi:MAG TPA: thioredoxin domain-containing protein [Rhodanobacteraceae bacterium]|nr:thioredoxin domain-containing protein [Rhodanobacteraceae bacterium]
MANIATGILVLCAIVVTTLVVLQYLSAHKTNVRISGHINNFKSLLAHRPVNLGSDSATLKIMEFSDYQCPYCRQLEPNLQALVKRYPNKVAVVRYDFPIAQAHAHAYKAAIASRCAGLQNVYEPFEAELFKADLGKVNWRELAHEAKVPDIPKFWSCVSKNESAPLVDADIKLANKLGINGTPTLVIRGDIISGLKSVEVLESLVSDN